MTMQKERQEIADRVLRMPDYVLASTLEGLALGFQSSNKEHAAAICGEAARRIWQRRSRCRKDVSERLSNKELYDLLQTSR